MEDPLGEGRVKKRKKEKKHEPNETISVTNCILILFFKAQRSRADTVVLCTTVRARCSGQHSAD